MIGVPDTTLLPVIEAYLRKSGMAPTSFGRAAVRDPRFVWDLRKGRVPQARTRRRIRHFIAQADTAGGA